MQKSTTDFSIGDIVVFADAGSTAWQGGKGEILTDIEDGYHDVKILELPPNNNFWAVGSTMTDKASNLKPYKEAVTHPAHYGGADNPYEVIKVAEAWGLDKDAYLFNVVKYVARAGKKDPAKELEDLKKGLFYYQRRIKQLEEAQSST